MPDTHEVVRGREHLFEPATEELVALVGFAAGGRTVNAGDRLPADHELVRGRKERFRPATWSPEELAATARVSRIPEPSDEERTRRGDRERRRRAIQERHLDEARERVAKLEAELALVEAEKIGRPR